MTVSRQDVRGIPDYCVTTKEDALGGAVVIASPAWVAAGGFALFGLVMRGFDPLFWNWMVVFALVMFLVGVWVAIEVYWDGGIGGRWFCTRNRIVYPDSSDTLPK